MKRRSSNKRPARRRTTVRPRRIDTNHSEEIRNQIIDWLREAYGMERGLETSLQKQAGNDDLPSELRNRAARHQEETRRHAEQVESLLQKLGSTISGLKTGMGIVVQATKGMSTAFARDERIKDLLDAYSMEHFEIGFYNLLAAAGKKAGMPQVVQLCRRILPDEQRMAQALLRALPREVGAYLAELQTA